MTEAAHEVLPEKADLSAWLAVAAGTIGALMAALDTSIVNASLPTIQGEIGASGSEGTWISTAYLVAEIIMIPLAGWLEKVFGLRTFLLLMTGAFTSFSVLCGVSQTLDVMIVGRIGQGFTGGAMIPTALSIVATRLPPRQQPVGVALFGMTTVLGPVLGPILGGWLTENISWHYDFFLNVPVGIGLLVLLMVGLENRPVAWAMLREADGLGIVGLIMGLGGLTVVLEEGQRDYWFDSPMIRTLSFVSALGFAMLIAGQKRARRPVIQLRLLLDRSFAAVFLLSLIMGAALYGILYVVPQFLAQIADYNAQQAGYVAMISGIPTIAMLAVFPILVRWIDIRLAVALGLSLYAASCFLNDTLTVDTAGPQLVMGQVLRGFAMFFSMVFLNQAATVSVAHELAEDGSGLFNAARNLGGSMGLAFIGAMQERRVTFHTERLLEGITGNSASGQDAAATLGVGAISRQVAEQALVMTYADIYWLLGVGLVLMVPLAFLLKPMPKNVSTMPIG